MKKVVLPIALLILTSACTTLVNNVTKEPFEPDPTETTIGTDIDDLKMDVAIGVNIKKADSRLDASHINVHVYNAVVLLTGEVPSDKLKVLAGDAARNYYGVRQVHNELQIGGNSSIISRTNDSIITGHVKTKMIFNGSVDASDISVITEDGVVYLMGTITRASGAKAASVASNTRGVKKVVRVFEYID